MDTNDLNPRVERIKDFVDELTEDERLDLFRLYCRGCGSDDPKCQCENDE